MLVRQNRLAIQPKTSPLQPDSSSLQVTRIQMMVVVVIVGGGGGWAGLGWTGCRLGCRGWTSPSPSPSPNPTRSITRMPRPCARCARRRRGEEQRIAYGYWVLPPTTARQEVKVRGGSRNALFHVGREGKSRCASRAWRKCFTGDEQ